MTITAKSTIAPEVVQVFEKHLLQRTDPFKPDDCDLLWKIYLYVKEKYLKKCNTPRRIEKFHELEKQFLEVYECTKEKEKNIERASDHITKMPIYGIYCINQRDQAIFWRLRRKIKLPKK